MFPLRHCDWNFQVVCELCDALDVNQNQSLVVIVLSALHTQYTPLCIVCNQFVSLSPCTLCHDRTAHDISGVDSRRYKSAMNISLIVRILAPAAPHEQTYRTPNWTPTDDAAQYRQDGTERTNAEPECPQSTPHSKPSGPTTLRLHYNKQSSSKSDPWFLRRFLTSRAVSDSPSVGIPSERHRQSNVGVEATEGRWTTVGHAG